ncbi:unnamed protein product [Oreochromis niloticus]|nr:unnamed protein product [Mustela putorius furo]
MIPFLVFWCLTGVCVGVEVRQTPSGVITDVRSNVEIFCSHEKTNYRVMLWYQQLPGETAMKLIGFLYFKAVTSEEQYKDNFNIIGDLGGNTAKNGSLIVKDAQQEHSAVYYCAAREAQ